MSTPDACPHCGTSTSEGQKFCKTCGQPLSPNSTDRSLETKQLHEVPTDDGDASTTDPDPVEAKIPWSWDPNRTSSKSDHSPTDGDSNGDPLDQNTQIEGTTTFSGKSGIIAAYVFGVAIFLAVATLLIVVPLELMQLGPFQSIVENASKEHAIELLETRSNQQQRDYLSDMQTLSDGQRQRWHKLLDEQALTLWKTIDAPRDFCQGLTFIAEGELLSPHWSPVLSTCADHAEALDALQAVQRANREERSAERELQSLVYEAEQSFQEIESRLNILRSRYSHLRGSIEGQMGNGEYEIRYNFGDRAILLTTHTSFSTTGGFNLWVESAGTTRVTLNSGRTITVPVYRESHDAGVVITEAQQTYRRNQRVYRDMQDEIEEQTFDIEDEAPYERAIDRAAADIADAVQCVAQPQHRDC